MKAVRQSLGMPRTYLAKKIGVKPATLAGMEQAEVAARSALKPCKKSPRAWIVCWCMR
ncbi:MAG: helix-turn-helix domain-containing protein [Verrucomicrobiales bacterium]|nr:helix-turn-helix domain-containing protein [Verrucomicrobiales bacterium]